MPILSFNYAARDIGRCKRTLLDSLIAGEALMFLGMLCFEFLPAIGYAVKSSVLTVVSTVVLFVPLGFLFSRFGLNYFLVLL